MSIKNQISSLKHLFYRSLYSKITILLNLMNLFGKKRSLYLYRRFKMIYNVNTKLISYSIKKTSEYRINKIVLLN